MSDQSCVTNVAPGMTACIIRGSHFASCDGFEYRFTEADTSTEHKQIEDLQKAVFYINDEIGRLQG